MTRKETATKKTTELTRTRTERQLERVHKKLDVIHDELRILFAMSRMVLAILKEDADEEAAADALLKEIEAASAKLATATATKEGD